MEATIINFPSSLRWRQNRLNFMAMKRIFILLVLFIPFQLLAQDTTKAKQKPGMYTLSDHLVYGGNMGLNFGNVTSIGISPFVGYKVTPKFIPGIGASYTFIKFNFSNYPSESMQIYGGSIWSRYYVLENLFAYGEYEVLNGEWDPYYRPNVRYNLNSTLLGGGYQQSFGGLSSYVLVLYNVTQDADSPYMSPLIIRVGIGLGI